MGLGKVAAKSVDLMMQSPARDVTLEFQGGEPLNLFDAIRHIVRLAKKQAANLHKELEIVICTNLSWNLTDDILIYSATRAFKISTSLGMALHSSTTSAVRVLATTVTN